MDGQVERNGGSPLIWAEQLSRVYTMGSRRVIGVDRIDLSIEAGQLAVIKGNSGSGKSTLLSLLAGLDRPTGGRLFVAGSALHEARSGDLTRFRRTAVGMVFQTFNLLPTLTVLENVALPGLLAGEKSTPVRRRAAELLDRFAMTHRSDHLPGQLSGGEMQRTAIARALINDPEIILADEPTGNLDSRNAATVVDLLGDLNRQWGRTIIVATHSDLADPYATLQIRLSDGAIVSNRRRPEPNPLDSDAP
ncbi:MAG: ABC transporter ATP-binding protein [Desulfobacterales bacterium]|jgi:ABC-type lipoprotein export system ATPase subunit